MLQDAKNNRSWLIIIYRVPSTTSTSRVTVWRKVKELGAFLLQQSVYILPNSPPTREAVNALKEQIQHLGGECKILEIASLGEEQEKEVITGFNNNREEEYAEVIKACKELLQEIDEESKTEDFHFADLEENEKHLQRVRELLEGIIKRDYFESGCRAKAVQMINKCDEKFEAFSLEVFSREGIVSDEKKSLFNLDIIAKYKRKQAFTRSELIAKLRGIINSLNHNTLEVGTKKVSPLPDQSILEWDYQENKEKSVLEIKVMWTHASTDRKGHE
jgi:CRISPR/Cas system-associated endoribonuclease Cas2